MPEKSSSSATVTFIDWEQTVQALRAAVRQARAAHPEIVRVFLFGSLVNGDWTADSDADLIVVVRRDFPDLIFSRSPYRISCRAIPTDSLVYSEDEFARLSSDPTSFVAQALRQSIELSVD